MLILRTAMLMGLVIAMTAACESEYLLPEEDSEEPEATLTMRPPVTVPLDFSPIPDLPPVTGDPEPLILVYVHDRLCETDGCEGTLTIYENGAYRWIAGGLINGGYLSHSDFDTLQTEIAETDFDALRATPFTGVCRTDLGSYETIYLIRTEGGQERLSNCEHSLDYEMQLFALLKPLFDGMDLEIKMQDPLEERDLLNVVSFMTDMGDYRLIVDAKGNYSANEGQNGTLTPDQLSHLQGLVQQTDFQAIRAVRKEDECTFDEVNPIIDYYIKTSYGVEAIGECANVIDHSLPLIAWVDALVSELSAE